jgi:aspartyl-tRNA(Asn)/glutamyl-tRNA(Gln) amidotransferase subunit A
MTVATLETIADELASGLTSSRALVEQCLARIADPKGQGATVFLQVDGATALGAADAMDLLRSAGAAPSRYAGIPVSVKDLFDIENQVTRAGSRVLENSPPARSTAPAVARLRAAGFVIIGRTNMTEFAFSGLGLNPHYGTPLSPWRPQEGHIAGGSTSGGAASVADGMAYAALGTDTGGSCRIPAAFTGLVGFKPTASRVPKDGAVPLSRTLDCVGPIARSVDCCAILDAILSNEAIPSFEARDLNGIRVLVPTTIGLDNLDPLVASAFERTLRILSESGIHVTTADVPEFSQIPVMNAKGGFAAAESYAWHAALLSRDGDRYDPRVSVRIRRGAQQSAADLISLMDARAGLIEAITARMRNFDVLVLPTVPITPPRIKDLEDDEEYTRVNLLALRNPSIINMMDGCAISIPMQRDHEPPMGLMIAACNGQDRTVLEVARAFETALANH